MRVSTTIRAQRLKFRKSMPWLVQSPECTAMLLWRRADSLRAGPRIPWDALGEKVPPSWSAPGRGGFASLGTKELAGPISLPCPLLQTNFSKQHSTNSGSLNCLHQAWPPCTLLVLLFWASVPENQGTGLRPRRPTQTPPLLSRHHVY